MSLKSIISHTFRKLGITVRRFPSAFDQGYVRSLILNHLGIDTVLDVGANVGNYGQELREFGYTGRIISFEPVAELHAQVQQRANSDRNWLVEHAALGDVDGSAEINVANDMSSMLERSNNDNDTLDFAFKRKETIKISRLDAVAPGLLKGTEKVWLKMDVQGFEMQVLQGAEESLSKIMAVETELSLWAYYKSQDSYREIIDHLLKRGFDLWSIAGHGAHAKTGRMADFDGIFVRREQL